ncbi:MAG: protein kinase [Acidobacteriota bacterium]
MTMANDPEIVGPYRIEAELGSGGMGAVYRAYDQRLDRWVAIKRIHGRQDTDRGRQRFLREARAAASLNHPAIVQVHDLLQHDQEDWLVMELVEGISLASMLRDGPLPWGKMAELGRDIAAGLEHAHRSGIIHRDLKAENVMVSAEGHAKILDFGLAKKVFDLDGEPSLTASGAVVGTFRAMSPEQARGLELSPASDLFSFGSLLYQMVSGVPPFVGRTPLDTVTRICSHEPAPLATLAPDAPRRLTELIAEMMRKEPARRPESAAEVELILASIVVSGAATVSRPVASLDIDDPDDDATTRPPDLGSMSRPRPHRWHGLVIGALVFAIGVGGWTLWSSRATPVASGQIGVSEPSTLELLDQGRTWLETFHRPDDLEQAILSFEQALDREPGSAVAYAGLSRAYWRRWYAENRDPLWLDKAEGNGRRAVELEPYLTSGRISLALALTYLGRLDAARETLEGLIELDPTNADLHRVWSDIYLRDGDLDQATTSVQRAVDLRPDDFDLYNARGVVAFRRGDLDQAAASFERGIELAPDSFSLYRNLAGVHHARDDLAAAASMMQKALAIRADGTIFGSLGIVYFDQGLYRDAARVFERAIEMPGGGNNYRNWANLADAYRWIPDRQPEARDAYGRAIALLRETGNDNADTRSLLALYQAKRGDGEAARRLADSLDTLDYDGPQIAYRIATTWEILGERSRALEALGIALASGYYSLGVVRRDPELTDLRADAGFHRLVPLASVP